MTRLRFGIITAAFGFLAGVILLAGLAWKFGKVAVDVPAPESIPSTPSAPPAPIEPLPPPAIPSLSVDIDPIADLQRRSLEVPVEGVARGALRESFDEMRNGTQKHEGIDILAPRNTPVLAVEDGVIAKLFTSVPGGLTVYQFDPSRTYAYYYAHLERYADGLAEGMRVTRKQVLGYVGTSGNAPKNTPHLHFEISRLTDAKQWWTGTAIDPFRVLK